MGKVVHPLTRIIVVACLAICAVAIQSLPGLAVILAVSIVLLVFHAFVEKDRSRLLKQVLSLLPVILSLFIIQMLFSRQGNMLWQKGGFTLYDQGLETASQVALRLLILLCSGAVLWNLPTRQFVMAFRSAAIPETFTVMVLMTLRFLPQLSEQVRQSVRQIKLRGIQLSKVSLSHRLLIYKNLLLPILGWTLKDLKYRAIALDARGFRNGKKHTHFRQRQMGFIDWLIIGVTVLIAVLLYRLL